MSAELEQPIVEEAASLGESASDAVTPAASAVPDNAVERDLEADTLEIPDSSAEGGKVKYVPASALSGARAELKELKGELASAREGSAKAQQLEARIDDLSSQLASLAPKAQAYDAAVAAQHHQPPQVEDPNERATLEEIARDYDFYKADGQLDLDKSRRHINRVRKEAQDIAQQQVAPLARHTVTQQSNVMLARAKATTAPNGQKPDPAILDAIWARLDPSLTATPDGAKQAYAAAMGYTALTSQQAAAAPATATRTADGKFTKADVPDPLYTETAGGKDGPAHVSLSDHEKKYLKDAGISEKEYLESANGAPWLRR